jgi:hypothetical protein
MRAESWEVWPPSCGLEGAIVATAGGQLLKAAPSAVKRSDGDPEFATKVRDILDRTWREIDALKL